MTEEEITATARKMIALYGSDAEAVAEGHTVTHAECEEILEMLDWSRIATKICDSEHIIRNAERAKQMGTTL